MAEENQVMKEPQGEAQQITKEPQGEAAQVQRVTTKNPKKVEAGKRLAESNRKMREAKKREEQVKLEASGVNQYYGIGAVLALRSWLVHRWSWLVHRWSWLVHRWSWLVHLSNQERRATTTK